MELVRIEIEEFGNIDLELYPTLAPITVKNFLDLVDKGFYDGTIFHRIIKDFMAQGGGYVYDKDKNTLYENGELDPIKGEFRSNGVTNDLQHTLGVISMARTSVKDSATSQFFICTDSAPHLDGEYAAFGKVTDKESLKVLNKLNNVRTVNIGGGLSDFPYPVVKIKTIKRL